MPIYPKAGQAKIYIKALEDRIAELETTLNKGGDRTVSRDHWAEQADNDYESESGDIQPLLNAVRDLSLDVAGSYIGGASTITLGRALETALAGRTELVLPYMGGVDGRRTGHPMGSFSPEALYDQALENRETILQLGDTRSLTYLLLLGQHSVRMPRGPGAWTFFGLAMKMCIELGLHRKRRSWKISFESELNKRLFWSAYAYDRELAIVMGRPPLISDHDIDVDLPLDVDEATQDLNVLRKATTQDRSRPTLPQTSMTTFIHLLRLKRIEADIQHKIYRVDKAKSAEWLYKKTDMFLEHMIAWKDAIPPEATSAQLDSTDRQSFRGDEYRRHDNYMASYHKAIRVLLQPRLYEKTINPRYLHLIPLVFSSVSLQTVFLAGLTLVYCMWQDASNVNSFRNFGALSDCSIILYVMTERWPASRKYRDIFEAVKKSVLDAISEGKHIPRTAVTTMKDDMQNSIPMLQVNPATETIPDDLEQMISDMTGEQISFWDDVDMTEIGDGPTLLPTVDEHSQSYALGTSEWDVTVPNFWTSDFPDGQQESGVS
ncbi:hypothetical protein BLS_000838 [Venturia inaequalis]|uniref:Xylanolytic transcriptional activator regulatory domain-containing protein n=1 Tax=Venturia inaequalis TaxID=5025 RepID=A0A8H3YXY4_VENIN|nr:hypothetical protein BLS_000838 [Venturia inaequalis]